MGKKESTYKEGCDCPLCTKVAHQQALIDKLKDVLEAIDTYYSASLDHQPPYVRLARRALVKAKEGREGQLKHTNKEQAYGHLIAVAPEMLEELKEVSKILRTFKSSFSGGKITIVEKINRVDGLIMKAEGREGNVRDF